MVNVVGVAAAGGIDNATVVNVVGIAPEAVVVVVVGGGCSAVNLTVVEVDVVDENAEEDAAVVVGGGCSAASLRMTLTHDSSSSLLSQSSPSWLS